MRWRRALFVCVSLIPYAAQGQEVRVRLYTNRTPSEVTVRAVDGEIHWRACLTCEEKTGKSITFSANAPKGMATLFVEGNYELRPVYGPLFAANYPLRLERGANGILVTVTLPLEEYVEAVLAAESGDFQNDESMKAMAVAVRTYAVRFEGQHEKDGFDFCDTTHCQAIGWRRKNDRIRDTVHATQGEILQYRGVTAATYYHANCGGKTAAAKEVWPSVSAAYLTVHADGFCAVHGEMKWESTISVGEIQKALANAGITAAKDWKTIDVASRTESGRVQRLVLRGGTPEAAQISGSTFRFAVDRALGWDKIRSDLYEVRNNGEQIVFSGRGAGHGVGLCQTGAEEMAHEGKSYREILNFYYPGTQIVQSQATQWQTRGGERIELWSTQPEEDAKLLEVAERILKEDEAMIGWKAPARVRLQVFPSLDAYRDKTGEPGWVAASTRGNTIRLQPLKELQRRSIMESTLRHELLHVLVESAAKKPTPVWFREGLVLFLSLPNSAESPAVAMTDEEMEKTLRQSRNHEEVQKAYGAARHRVEGLVQQYGKITVLSWLGSGIPHEVVGTN